MSSEKALVPVEQKVVDFYEDRVTAIRVTSGDIYIPLRPIIERLGLDWASQTRRLNRDPVLVEVKGVVVTTTPGGRQEMLALPLDYLSGFLFGVNANRVRSDIRERVILYQRECYKVLAEAFSEGRLTADPSFDELLASDSPAAMAYKMASALQIMARQQLMLESRLEQLGSAVETHDRRLETIENRIGDPGRYISPDQAMQLSQAVKTVAMKLSKASGRNEYGGVYGELYRKFGITSYKQLPAARFDEGLNWLNEWREGIEGDVPF